MKNIILFLIHVAGLNNPGNIMKKTYKILFSNGTEEIVTGLKQFATERGYTPQLLHRLCAGTLRAHKDILSVKHINS